MRNAHLLCLALSLFLAVACSKDKPTAENTPENNVEESAAESAEDNTAESAEDNTAESAEENTAESAEENIAESAEENIAESAEENTAESAEENTAESTPTNEQSPQDVAGEKANPSEAENNAPDVSGWDDDDALDWPMTEKQVASVELPEPAPGETSDQFASASTGRALSAVWGRMGQYGESYLQNWDEALQGEAPNATEVVDAFNELAYAVTGPTGFWRATLPNNWLGCRQDPSSAPCLKLTGAQPELARWDEIQENLSNMPERQAGTFLRRNKRSILAYFDNYVPQEPSSSAMKQTLYYQEHLIGLLD